MANPEFLQTLTKKLKDLETSRNNLASWIYEQAKQNAQDLEKLKVKQAVKFPSISWQSFIDFSGELPEEQRWFFNALIGLFQNTGDGNGRIYISHLDGFEHEEDKVVLLDFHSNNSSYVARDKSKVSTMMDFSVDSGISLDGRFMREINKHLTRRFAEMSAEEQLSIVGVMVAAIGEGVTQELGEIPAVQPAKA